MREDKCLIVAIMQYKPMVEKVNSFKENLVLFGSGEIFARQPQIVAHKLNRDMDV